MSITKPFALFAILTASGCGAFERGTPVDPHAIEAVVVNKNEPPPTCRFLGEVAGEVIIGALESAKKDLVKNAAEGGGNYVALDMTERHPGGYGMVGRLFQCPTGPGSDVAAAPQAEPLPVKPPSVASAEER